MRRKGETGADEIKVGFCVAYDWPLLAFSLPRIYQEADSIWLSIDEDQMSWSNRKFSWNEVDFNALVQSIDNDGKIQIYRDNFRQPGLTPPQNEVRQRKMLSDKMGPGGWHIQLDCDEYFLDFNRFVRFLKNLPPKSRKFNVSCQLLTVFKKVTDGYLYVYPDNEKQYEFLQIASRSPHFEHGRRNGYFNIYTDCLIVHQSWARTNDEIFEKLANWGHVNDFDVNSYFQFWRGVTAGNFTEVHNFHPIVPNSWRRLRFVKAKSVTELIDNLKNVSFPTLSAWSRILRNSLIVSRLRYGRKAFANKIFTKAVQKLNLK